MKITNFSNMKKILSSALILFLILVLNTQAKSQCLQKMVYQCATKGQSIYLRDFNAKLKASKDPEESGARWTVVLNKGAHYRFNLCTPPGFEDKVILTLYDSQHPETTNPWGSTYDPKNDQHFESFDFICRKSGMYYVSIRFKEGVKAKKSCAVGILSFVGSAE